MWHIFLSAGLVNKQITRKCASRQDSTPKSHETDVECCVCELIIWIRERRVRNVIHESYLERAVPEVPNTYPVMHNTATRTGTIRKYPRLRAMNMPSLKKVLLRVLSTQDTPQTICKSRLLELVGSMRKLRSRNVSKRRTCAAGRV